MINKISLQIAALLLCGGSLLCSVGLWVNEQQTYFAMVLAGVFAVALELCKFSFFPIAAKQFRYNQIAGVMLCLLSFLLLCISVAATAVFFETGTTTSINNSVKSSDMYLLLKSDIRAIEQQIKTTNKLMNNDINNGFRKRTYPLVETLGKLQADKSRAINKLNNLKTITNSGAHSILDNVATLLNVSVKSVRQGVYTAVAVLVDVCGIVCLLILSVFNKKTNSVNVAEQNVNEQQLTENSETTKQNSQHADINKIAEAIAGGDYGDKPVIRQIMSDFNLTHPKAKQIFNALVSDGVLEQVNRRYQLVA